MVVKIVKIILINAKNDGVQSEIANDGSYPAIAPLALGTWLNQRIADIEVQAYDGQVRSQEELKTTIETEKPDLVGISVLCTSYQNSLELAGVAKDSGAVTIFGNDQASQRARKILENRDQVDFVIGAEYGELPLELLVRHTMGEKIELADIPSLTYRRNGEAVGFDFENEIHRKALAIKEGFSGYPKLHHDLGLGKLDPKTALDMFPILDRTMYTKEDWNKYLERYIERFGHLHDTEVSGVTTMNRARGCNRQLEAICKHCDLLLDISSSSAKIFWEEVRQANADMGATSFYESCDSFSSFPHLMKLAESKPSDLGFDPQFFVYCQAVDLVKYPERVDHLKEMGVFRVNIGLESMNDTTLKHMKGEDDSVKKNYEALELMKDAGIHVYASFVFGSEKETPYTLNQTVERVEELIWHGYFCDVEAQPVLPLGGNDQGKVMKKHGMFEIEGQPSDWPDNVDTLAKQYINNFSGVSYQDCIDASDMIRASAKKATEQGIITNYGSGVAPKDSFKVK